MKRALSILLACMFLATAAYADTVRLVIDSCCVTEDATTKEILPAFKKYYKEKFGKDVDISASFAGSGTLKNQILGGAPVQVAILWERFSFCGGSPGSPGTGTPICPPRRLSRPIGRPIRSFIPEKSSEGEMPTAGRCG